MNPDQFIMQMRPLFGEEEKRAVCEYMDREDGFLTEFKRTERFEQMIADYTGAKHCIVVNNGHYQPYASGNGCRFGVWG